MKKLGILLLIGFVATEIICSLLIFRTFMFPLKYLDLINIYSNKYDLSNVMIASVINIESRYNEKSISKVGAIGLMQIMPTTANYINNLYGLNLDISKLDESQINIQIGCAYLNYLSKKFSNTYTVLCGYNAGETVVKNWLTNPSYSNDGKSLKIIPYKETNNYIKKYKINYKIYKLYNI